MIGHEALVPFFLAGVRAKPHGATHVGDSFLLLHQINYRIGCVAYHFSGIGFLQSQNISGKLNNRTLHCKANAKEGYTVLPGIPNSFNFTLNSPMTKAGSYQYALQVAKLLLYI